MEDANYCDEIPRHEFAKSRDVFVFIGATIYVLMTLFILLFIRYASWRAKNLMHDDDGEANSVIFPIFVYVLYVQALVSCFVGCVVATFSLEVGESNDIVSSSLFALAWSLQHIISEGTVIILLQPGCGRYAIKNAAYTSILWGILTFALYVSIFTNIIYKSTIWRAVFDFGLVVFYGYLWLIPERYLSRRPSVIYYSKFWFCGSFIFLLLHLGYMFHLFRSRTWCGNYFFRIFIYAIMQPILSYFVFYYDSLWWQGIDSRISRRGISAPTFTLYSAQTLAEVLDNVNVIGKVELLNYSSIQIDNKAVLGAGSFSKVVLGRYDGNTVAIKTVHTYDLTIDIINRIATESKILSTIKHENIVAIYGVAVLPPSICIVLELCKYGSLSDILRGCQRKGFNGEGSRFQYPLHLSFHDLIFLSLGAARGLSAIHSFNSNLCHRDIKSFNFLVDSQLKVKLADLELGNNDHLDHERLQETWDHAIRKKFSSFNLNQRTISSSSAQTTADQIRQKSGSISSSNDIIGHNSILNLQAMWLAPEVIQTGKFSQPSDVYGLGMVLWEIKTRRFPFEEQCGSNQNEIRRSILGGVRPTMSLSDWNEHPAVYLKCLERYDEIMTSTWCGDPSMRPSATIVAYKLEQILRSCGVDCLASATSFPSSTSSPMKIATDRPPSGREFLDNESVISSTENILTTAPSKVTTLPHFSAPPIPPPSHIPSWQCFDYHGGPWIVISTEEYRVVYRTNLWNSLISQSLTSDFSSSESSTLVSSFSSLAPYPSQIIPLAGRNSVYDKRLRLISTIFQSRFRIPSADLHSTYNDTPVSPSGGDENELDREEDEALTNVLFNSRLMTFIENCEVKGYCHLVISEKERKFHRENKSSGESLFALHGHLLEKGDDRGGTSANYIAILSSQIESNTNVISPNSNRNRSVSFSFRPRMSSIGSYMYSERNVGTNSGRIRKLSVESGRQSGSSKTGYFGAK